MAGRWKDISWQGRKARAWVPDPIATRRFELDTGVARRTEQAAAAVRRADEVLPGSWEPIARVLLRSEGVASSDIEGLRAPIEAVMAAEIDEASGDSTAAWIADNLATVTGAVQSARRGRLTVRTLHAWHRRLMRNSRLPPSLVGHFRDSQGWIGRTNPTDAVYVPPPARHVTALVDDLVAFADRTDLDPVSQAAILHAQFESIHPYGDGNGRLGRVLISWLLARRLEVALPPPLSVFVARDPGGYLSGLYEFRDGSLDRYVAWFADVVDRAGRASVELGSAMVALLEEWQVRLDGLRSDATARRVASVLPEQPIVTSATIAARLDVSERAARGALESLADRGIVQPIDHRAVSVGRPRTHWLATELVELIASWSR
jgi:Fic family protein